MPTLVDTFLDMASDLTETQPFASEAGYRNIVSDQRTSLTSVLGSEMSDSSHLGHTLRATLYGEVVDNGQFHGGAGFTTQSNGTNTGFKLTSEMAYHYNYVEYNESEIEAGLNPKMDGDYIKLKFQETMGGKMQNAAQANVNKMEAALWAPADEANMFTSPNKPVSFPALITEHSSGRALQADGTNITNVYNAPLSSVPTFKNQAFTYASTGGNAADGEDLLGALEEAWLESGFEPIPIGEKFGPGGAPKQVYFCSSWGLRIVMGALRNGQTQWGQREFLPGGGGVRIGSMLFRPITALNTAALYDDGSSGLTTEALATINGPRFYGVDTECTKVLMEEGHWMRMEEPVKMTTAGKPYEVHQGIKSKLQLWSEDLRRNTIVSPLAGTFT